MTLAEMILIRAGWTPRQLGLADEEIERTGALTVLSVRKRVDADYSVTHWTPAQREAREAWLEEQRALGRMKPKGARRSHTRAPRMQPRKPLEVIPDQFMQPMGREESIPWSSVLIEPRKQA
jgi:hypothetical protein